MSTPPATWNRRRRRWLIAMLAMACAGAVAFVRATRRAERVERLVVEINQSDGYIRFGMSVWERIGQVVKGHATDCGTLIKLPSKVDQKWFESRDYLADLPLGNVQVADGQGRGSWLAPLVANHPVEILFARGATGSDEIAAALSDKRSLINVHLSESDLTDAGLKQLPLEHLQILDIANTQVTAQGLREIRRAGKLQFLSLDGGQINAEIATLLEQVPQSYTLLFTGPQLTDATLQVLTSVLIQFPAHKLERMIISNSSVTDAGLDAWKQALHTIPIGEPTSLRGPPIARPNLGAPGYRSAPEPLRVL